MVCRIKLRTPNKGAATVGRKRRDPDLKTYYGRLADRMRALREAKRLTVDQLADRVGVSISTAYAWENGTREMAWEDLPRVAKALGCKTVSELVPPK